LINGISKQTLGYIEYKEYDYPSKVLIHEPRISAVTCQIVKCMITVTLCNKQVAAKYGSTDDPSLTNIDLFLPGH